MMLGMWWLRLQTHKFGLCQVVSVCVLSQFSDIFCIHHQCLCSPDQIFILISTAPSTLSQIHSLLFSVITQVNFDVSL